MTETDHYDVAILGGGLAGLTLSKQLLMQRPETKVLVIEKHAFPVDEVAFKVGESTVEIGAHYLGEELQLKKHLLDDQLPKFGLRFFFNHPHQPLVDATEVGGSEFFPAPSYQVDRGRLENFLSTTVTEMGATLLAPAKLKQVNFAQTPQAGENHEVVFEREGREESAKCRWVVDASGRACFLKRQLNLEEDIEHDINAIWFRLDAEIRIDEWCDDPDWQTRSGRIPRRWLSTNHLLGDGYWVWLIPLATGATSVGIVADPRLHKLSDINSYEKAFAWLEEYEPLCAEKIEPHREKLKDFLAIKNIAKGCRQIFSADRWALTGEAGVFLDPFYSPGSDYIAIANTMICRLIQLDLGKQPIEHIAPTFQSIFLTLFQNNLLTYKDQYPLFGNPRIMSLKIAWDYALYWCFPALLYFNEKLTDPSFIQSLSKGIEEMRDMNLQMQQFFRNWHEVDAGEHIDPAFVDQRAVDILIQLNTELREKLSDQALKERFTRNVGILRDLMNEIMGRVEQNQPELVSVGYDHAPSEHRLEGIFAALNL